MPAATKKGMPPAKGKKAAGAGAKEGGKGGKGKKGGAADDFVEEEVGREEFSDGDEAEVRLAVCLICSATAGTETSDAAARR
eukprot:953636-Rhodomonas_salina.1